MQLNRKKKVQISIGVDIFQKKKTYKWPTGTRDVFHITNNQGNANQNRNVTSPPISNNGYHPKDER